MVGKDLEVGDLVWAKMKSFPPWPSKITEHPKGITKKGHHYVYFFGSENYAWIKDDQISLHSEAMVQAYSKKKSVQLQKAIDVIRSESQKSPSRKVLDVQDEEIVSEPESLKLEKEKKKKKVVKAKKVPSPVKVTHEKKKVPKKRPIEINGDDNFNFIPIRKKQNFGMTDKSATSYNPVPESHPTQPSGILQRKYVELAEVPPLDIEHIRETLRAKNVKPTTKKIGFLGLGALGRGIVKNLLNSGHNVTVWNRDPDRCEPFVKAGALTAKTPADVVESCDITFCCVSDPTASKTLIFGTYGVLKGLEGCEPLTKSYVELTGIDPETSQEIAKEIFNKGGRYLEAPCSGSRSIAEDGQLLIIAAGDRELFNECQSCFSAFSKHAYFISLDLGNASRMSTILSMFKGTLIAALGEALTLVERCKLSPENFLSILECGSVSLTQMLRDKGQAMMKPNYVTDIALRHQQKDLILALALANEIQQPLHLASEANEIYKRAKFRGYYLHDVSAVVEGMRL